MDHKRKGVIRRPRIDIYIAVCLNDEKKLSCEKKGRTVVNLDINPVSSVEQNGV